MSVLKFRGYKWDILREPQGWVAHQRGGKGITVTATHKEELTAAIEAQKSLRARNKPKSKGFRRMPMDYEKLNPWLRAKFPGATAVNYAIEPQPGGTADVVISYTMDVIPEGENVRNRAFSNLRQIRISYLEAATEKLLQEEKKATA